MNKGYLVLVRETIDSIKFYIDSKKGKYSLFTYLDIIGAYADQQIIDDQGNGLRYVGGECIVRRDEKKPDILEFVIELYFENSQNESIKKESKRRLPLTKFVRETVEIIGSEPLTFNINEPEGE